MCFSKKKKKGRWLPSWVSSLGTLTLVEASCWVKRQPCGGSEHGSGSLTPMAPWAAPGPSCSLTRDLKPQIPCVKLSIGHFALNGVRKPELGSFALPLAVNYRCQREETDLAFPAGNFLYFTTPTGGRKFSSCPVTAQTDCENGHNSANQKPSLPWTLAVLQWTVLQSHPSQIPPFL